MPLFCAKLKTVFLIYTRDMSVGAVSRIMNTSIFRIIQLMGHICFNFKVDPSQRSPVENLHKFINLRQFCARI
jgi:hypothetical protein